MSPSTLLSSSTCVEQTSRLSTAEEKVKENVGIGGLWRDLSAEYGEEVSWRLRPCRKCDPVAFCSVCVSTGAEIG